MVDVQQMRAVPSVRQRAWQIMQDARVISYPTADLDAGLLNEAADYVEKSAAEIDRLRELISG